MNFQDIVNKIHEIKGQYAKNGMEHENMTMQYKAAVEASEQILGALIEMTNKEQAETQEASASPENAPQA